MDMGTQFWAGETTLLWVISQARVLVRLCAPHSHPSASQWCFPGLAPGPGELSIKVLGAGEQPVPSCASWGHGRHRAGSGGLPAHHSFGNIHARSQQPLWLWHCPDCCVPWAGSGAFPLLPALQPCVLSGAVGTAGCPHCPQQHCSAHPSGWCTTGRRGSPRAMGSASTRTRRRRSAPCATSTGASSAAVPYVSTTLPARRTRRSSRVSQDFWGLVPWQHCRECLSCQASTAGLL